MNGNQKICCSVKSCKYNNLENRCELAQIQVSPTKDCNTKMLMNQCVLVMNIKNKKSC